MSAIRIAAANRRGPVLATIWGAAVLAAVASAGAEAGEVQVSKFRYAQPADVQILLCPATVAPADCDARNALAAIAGPPGAENFPCGVHNQQMLAGSGIPAREGQDVKVACAKATAQAD